MIFAPGELNMSSSKKANFHYDHDNDILYIFLEPRRPSFCVKEIDDIYIMQDLETGEYSSITILDFKQRLKSKSYDQIDLPISVDFAEIAKQISQPL